ncbi:SDR family oxidoreductase [Myxosarcina sp. GI1(2024)]
MKPLMNVLIAGVSGIIGRGTARVLNHQSIPVKGLARREVAGIDNVRVDLCDREATVQAIAAGAANTTHLFYAALAPHPNLSIEARQNAQMLDNLISSLEKSNAPLERVVIYQGFKIYGIHLPGAVVPTPAREDDASHMPPNLYQAQEAILAQRAPSAPWDYVVLRPDLVVDGNVYGNPMNIALTVGVFAELSRELGVPLRYPGTNAAYKVLMQFTDADLLGRASLWAATTPEAGGEAFNVTNGDVFRWERLWLDVANHLGLETAPPMPLKLTEHMADKGDVWRRLAERHGLVEPNLDSLLGWEFGDMLFNTETDIISDVNKLRRFGFTETADARQTLLKALERLKAKRILP